MNIQTIGKTFAVIFGLWSLWVAWEVQHTIRGLTSTPPPRVELAPPTMGNKLAMMAPGLPSTERVRLPQPQVEAPEIPVPAQFAHTANEAAEMYLQEKKGEWGVREYHELRPVTYETPMGTKVKYSAFQDGLPILGSEITLEVTTDREVTVADSSYLPIKKADVSQPVLNFDQILEKTGKQLDLTATNGVSKLLFVPPGSDEPELSYSMAVKEGSGPTENVIFRASDGMVLGRQTPRVEFPQ